MRDVNRLYGFYNELMRIHMENFPDWRFGQLIENFEGWIRDKTNYNGIFYIEEEDLLRYINEFVKNETW